ncbi:HEPN domain-containing protein [Infirmifilum lucidum]|uniref:HEPN domain-containing protein n=1 Tax=Infirmifilum lucidum TaxID=2776706 RepID=A0A7L9FHS8_9CREN|nr:HEPN domain-containing protein [Infirmifilum lucidum]QOJ79211.1 HEPN domain-containing protein [Infirmifilum lucidum]
MGRREEYEYLVERSKRFYETALMQIERGFYDLACFSLEQSLQLYLKASLLMLGVDFPRTHSVRRLLELIREVTDDNKIAELLSKFSVELGVLEDAYITSRYVARSYTADEVERVRRTVEEVVSVVGGVARERSKA